MQVLFLHDAFPAQFGHLALELTKRYGWSCHFLVEDLSSCPLPSAEMLATLDVRKLPYTPEYRNAGPLPWPQVYARFLESSETIYEAVKARPDLKPDLVVAHGGRGAPSILVREAVDCPIINYCEYYFSPSHSDISYRVDLPPAEPAPFFPRCINAPVLVSLADADAGYSATRYQRSTFPERFQHKIEVHFDGVDTELYRPGKAPRVVGGEVVPEGTRIVTFVSRGLESIRGFDVFMKVAARIQRERPDVLFVVVGSEETYYGWDKLHTGEPSFKQWVLKQEQYDLTRTKFLGHISPEELAELFKVTDLHFYLTAPFVLSWSLIDALSAGALVLGSDVAPVREVITPGVNGLIEPLFDVDRLADAALAALADPAAYEPLRRAARERILESYSLETCIPALHDYFERVAAAGPGPR